MKEEYIHPLYNDIELKFLQSFWENTEHRNFNDRSYEYAVLMNDEIGIITKLLNWFEKQTNEKLKSRYHSLIIHKYNIGDYFDKHIDSVQRDYKNRAYVVGFHINDNYEGGHYNLYSPDEIVNKVPGVPYCFKSNRIHEITKITKGYRKSGLIFINYEDLTKSNLL
tara:strand:+ start:11487 stop:11984 length:498 start_codon:yes stop_codon:yes gene_type:complete